MRRFDPKPICEKCGTKFELAVWGPRGRQSPVFEFPGFVNFVAEVPQQVTEKGDIMQIGIPEHLGLTCPVCGFPFEMQTAAQFEVEDDTASLYVPPEPPTESD